MRFCGLPTGSSKKQKPKEQVLWGIDSHLPYMGTKNQYHIYNKNVCDYLSHRWKEKKLHRLVHHAGLLNIIQIT